LPWTTPSIFSNKLSSSNLVENLLSFTATK
jgi:hypothetical protein